MSVTAILTAAGYATRLLPWSYSIPKEMLPVPINGRLIPAIQYVFEYLYDLGIRDFVIVTRKYKEVIMNHFSVDYWFIDYLKSLNKIREAEEVQGFFEKIEDSTISFVPSPPNGFGGAVLAAEKHVNTDFIFIAAPDMLLLEKVPINDNTVFVSTSTTPEKYGVVYGSTFLERIDEKPSNPTSNKIFLGYAVLDTEIFSFLREVKPDKNGEIQLTPAISNMAKKKKIRVYEVKKYYDIGNVQSYLEFLKNS